jgi:uncharacterized protein YhbP (UPF0306 family)
MNQDVDNIRYYLKERTTLTLATVSDAGPWVAAVFFAEDERLNLYFVSDPTTRHCMEAAAHPEIAATVHEDCRTWHSIQGLQIRGSVGAVAEEGRSAIQNLFLKKFPDVAELIQASEGSNDRLIADRLMQSKFYCITPSWIRFIDNTKGFGHRSEVTLAHVRQ